MPLIRYPLTIKSTLFVLVMMLSNQSSAEINSSQASHPPSAEPKIIADRIVVAINSIPYSQLQVERYINAKESLRDNASSSQVVQASNWNLALDAFIHDMAIHQDATKSSGFRPTRESIAKLRARSEKTIATAPQFKPAFDRLGLVANEIENEILKISTVENYRKGKLSLNLNGKDSTANWEKDLTDRTIVRYFDGAKTWVQTKPQP